MVPAMRFRALGISLAVIALALARTAPAAPVNPYPGYHSEIYADPAHWLCRGDTDDVCDHDLDATVIRADGRLRTERWHPARKPKIDCFYVYPTISTDTTGNSDFVPGDDQELFVVRQQAARLGIECRVFAPIYRQITLTGLLGALGGNPIPIDQELAYNDVVDAWKHYIANDNQGRGVVLIGHSQGSFQLIRLIKNEIDGVPVLRDRLVSAILLGASLQVPDGADVGGDFAHVPLCHSNRDLGCAITYGSFRATAPPPPNSKFGVSSGPGMKAACTNPAALGGGWGVLHPYLPTDGRSLPILPVVTPQWLSTGGAITTPFVSLPDFLEARCDEHDGFVYLAIRVNGVPSDPRIDDIGGDLTPDWGLHLVDANESMGDLVAITHRQVREYRRRHRP